MFKVLLVFMALMVSGQSFAEDLTDEKKRVIDEMLQITGALKVSEMMGTAAANQMIVAMSRQNKTIDPKAVEIVKDEVNKIMYDEFIANGFLTELSYKIYHKYFSLAEMKEMVAFYKTPTGAKMARMLPQVARESMLEGQKHGQSLGPVIRDRLMKRFQEEGVKQ